MNKTIKMEKPQPKQIEFMMSEAKYTGFGGARGGGKSWAVRYKAKLLAWLYAGIRVLIMRRTYPELIENHINILIKELYGVATYNSSQKRLTFPNGSIIKFEYCSTDKDLGHLQGTEWDVIFFDEATNFSEHQMKEILACLRGTNNFPKRAYFTCNPLGQGHGFIKRIFIDRNYTKGENPEDYNFIKSLVTDNYVLMQNQPEYIQQLEALPPKIRKAWLEGDWNIAGGFFDEFREEPDVQSCIDNNLDLDEAKEQHRFCHVIDPFMIPDNWTIMRSFDWGYAKPFSCSWNAFDDDGRMYRILEFYGCTDEADTGVRMHPKEVFTRIREIEETHPYLKGKQITGVADSAIWDAQTGKSIYETAADCGVFFAWKSDKARISGWMQCHYRLAFDSYGIPMFYVFSNCKDFIRTIPLLQYDEHNVEDIDTTLEDHIADEFRYVCMTRPIKPPKKVEESQYKKTRLYQALSIPEEELKKRPKKIERIKVRKA